MPRKLENVPSVPVDFVPVDLIRGLDAKAARVRFACLKDLVRLSRTTPEALYPSFDFFVQLLDSDNSIFQWNAARILANLAAVDRDSKLENVLDKLLAPIRGKQMIAAAVAIQSAPAIVRAKPHLADRVAHAILAVGRARYQTQECRNVALGHAIGALDGIFDRVRDKAAIARLVGAQLRNTRPATRKKAEKFLRKHSPAGARRIDTRRSARRET